MSTSDAQRSPVHAATEDSTAEPTGPGPAAQQPPQPAPRHPGTTDRSPTTAATNDDIARRAAELKSHPDTAEGIPSNFETGAAMARRTPDTDANPPGAQTALPAGPGSADASSGGGAGAGIPGGGTDLRTSAAFNTGNPADDRSRLFPDAPPGAANPGQQPPFNDETKIGSDPDESTYGGPLTLDDPDAV
jgi:hypothetical protein